MNATGNDTRVVEFDNVRFSYPACGPLFESLTFHVRASVCTALLGPSGAGKSTILRLIGGLEQPEQGTITRTTGPDCLGYLFQGNMTLPWRSVGRNIMLPLEGTGVGRADRKRRASEVLTSVGLPPAIYWHRTPAQLSGGQGRRVDLAMAVVRVPSLLLLDEPTQQLDPDTRGEIVGLIETMLTADRTALVVTHDLDDVLRLADDVFWLQDGRIAHVGCVSLSRPRAQLDQFDKRIVEARATLLKQLQNVRAAF